MNKVIFYILLIISLMYYSCSAPRGSGRSKKASKTSSRYSNTGIKLSPKSRKSVNKKQVKKVNPDKPKKTIQKMRLTNPSDPRFRDTTHIKLFADAQSANSVLETRFIEISKDFENEKYERACSEVIQFVETFAKGDSLQFEALFLWSECLIYENKINEAELILIELMEDHSIQSSILEKTIVRLGQVYCVQDKKKEAKTLFKRLKREYKKSIYLPIANCKAVEQ